MDFVKAVIFDLDDTLYPQIEYTRQCLMATSLYISKISGCEEEIIKLNLNSILDKNGIEYRFIFNDLFKEVEFDGMPYIKEILALFWQCNPQITLYPGANEVLNILKSRYRLAILSDGHENVQHYKIKTLGIKDFFEEILITDSLGVENRKPSPVPYKKLLTTMGLNPFECVYVGNDPHKDFLACKELGIKTVRIRQGDYKNVILDEVREADFEISDIKDLLSIIELNTGVKNG